MIHHDTVLGTVFFVESFLVKRVALDDWKRARKSNSASWMCHFTVFPRCCQVCRISSLVPIIVSLSSEDSCDGNDEENQKRLTFLIIEAASWIKKNAPKKILIKGVSMTIQHDRFIPFCTTLNEISNHSWSCFQRFLKYMEGMLKFRKIETMKKYTFWEEKRFVRPSLKLLNEK